MTEVSDLVRRLNGEWDEFKSKVVGRVDALEQLADRIDRLEAERESLPGQTAGGRLDQKAIAEQDRLFRRGLREGFKDRAVHKAMLEACSPGYLLQTKALSELSDAAGNLTVPEILHTEIYRKRAELSPLRRLVTVIPVTTSPGEYVVPVSLDNVSAGYVAEDGSRSETTTPTFQKPTFTHAELYAYPKISEWALDDAQYNLTAFIADVVADRFNAVETEAMLTGNGSAGPTGMLAKTPVTNDDDGSPMRAADELEYIPLDPGASPSDDITADALIDLAYSIRSQYMPGASWLMTRATAARVRKLKDDYGAFLWQPSLIQGQPPALLGAPVFFCEQMDQVGVDANAILYGDFAKAYFLLEKPLKMLADPFTAPGWVKLYIRQRQGGAIVDNNAVKVGRVVAA